MKEEQFYHMLAQHVPTVSIDYCYRLRQRYRFHFKLSKSRKTKLGDYRFDPSTKSHTISVNYDLNPYSFLITYIHEVAHLVVREVYGNNSAPHGKEWKRTFKELFSPLLNDSVFPQKILVPLVKYLRNPKASSYADGALLMALHTYDDKDNQANFLHQLESGRIFRIGSRVFKKGNTRRTRVLCLEPKTGRKYLISKMAEVEPL
ncbi:SprT-like domain-containing protein [Fulvivirgaceae bacterium BMA10]|uniref:SprT-like domain-containing protein n=1 Tax=Splendidivirga corallicola TaxID=3051826 RepID=A0ABT8KT63_9BACT|nr:SprT-like domain-containing protein [Fulvivirgaceae bacterium BMA10]